MILTGEHRSSWRKHFPSANLSTTNPTRKGLGLKPELRGETPATDDPSHGSAPIRLYRSVRLPRSCESLQVFGSQFLSQSICRPYLHFFIVTPILALFLLDRKRIQLFHKYVL
jgi:hypothetical protein